MQIYDMFADDINRKINGVIQVEQSDDDVIEQELHEYVITNELKKHFMSFFSYYSDAFDTPTADTGVWISGFFGSGKSHFLKMLSYILENRKVKGIRTVERFREKFADDPATFMMIDKSTRSQTEAILFNIDVESSINKDKTAVLRVFAKMFYNHLGFYGNDLKLSMLEHYIEHQGKTAAFRQAFEALSGESWVSVRRVYKFKRKHIIAAMVQVLDISEADALAWFSDKSPVEFSIEQLIADIKEYVDQKPKDFRLLFMADEVGQYVGTDTDLLLNLQSIVEKLGSECKGKVWVICTGQEAIYEIIKVRADEFSRIQARFKTRLSLTSSSVDEVIQKRILRKKPEAAARLEALYDANDSVLRNLFSFTDSILDIKGYSGPGEFAVDFPFVPYQFIIMQKVFSELRKHGNAGKHFSGGERSMLSGFQEAAQKIQTCDEYALVPFFRFYDTVHTFLDGSIRRVIERCQRAADSRLGIEPQDVDVLKLLYLIRYIDDVKANLDNIVILMADDLRADKITMRTAVSASLNRLMSQNYIARTGDTYNFLTDEEQDIQREIRNTPVDTAAIVERIGHMIFADIYTTKKYRYGKYDFAFDQMVDGTAVGVLTGGMRLRFLTVATDAPMKSDFRLMSETKGKEAAVVLADTPYYESLESAMKIRKYVKQRNIAQLPKSVQDIIRDQQDEASKYELTAIEELRRAIVEGAFFADGEKLPLKGGDAKSRIDQALEYLVSHVYSDLGLITWNAETDADILSVLNGTANDMLAYGMQRNQEAADRMYEYLEIQDNRKLPTSMADIQSRYSTIPYGWREIDIAAVAAKLIVDQRVTIKYAGTTIQPDNPKLPDMLRKKSEIGKTVISKRHVLSLQKMKQAREFVREFFEVMDIPNDEDGLIRFIVDRFTQLREHYEELNKRYAGHQYPDHSLITAALALVSDVLSQQRDNEALINRLLAKEDALDEAKEDIQPLEDFFSTQVSTFDSALDFLAEMRNDLYHIEKVEEANQALNTIRLICLIPANDRYNYRRIPELNSLMDTVRRARDQMLAEKRAELLEVVRQCMEDIHTKAEDAQDADIRPIIQKADDFFTQQKQRIASTDSLALLDGLMPPMWSYKDNVLSRLEDAARPKPPAPAPGPAPSPTPKKTYKPIFRASIFPAKRLETEADVDAYVEQMRKQLLAYMKGSDGIELK